MGSRFSNRLSELLLNPRFLLCFGIGWILTSGRSNVILTLGMLYRIRQEPETHSA